VQRNKEARKQPASSIWHLASSKQTRRDETTRTNKDAATACNRQSVSRSPTHAARNKRMLGCVDYACNAPAVPVSASRAGVVTLGLASWGPGRSLLPALCAGVRARPG
jgi:hypothetical protein